MLDDYSFQQKINMLLSPQILSLLTKIYECKGQLQVYLKDSCKEANELSLLARLQSIEYSNKLAHIVVEPDRMRSLAMDKLPIRNKDEGLFAGLRDALSLVELNFPYLQINIDLVLMLYGSIIKNAPKLECRFRQRENVQQVPELYDFDAFRMLEANNIVPSLNHLCDNYATACGDPSLDPLLIIAIFYYDFLCIKPFTFANGRVGRLLLQLLLLQQNFSIGKYCSIDKLICEHYQDYIESFQNSFMGSHKGLHDYSYFVKFFLQIILLAYQDGLANIELMLDKQISKPNRIRELIKAHGGKITKSELVHLCPGVSQTTVQRALNSLVDDQTILKIGGGRYTYYEWNTLRNKDH